MDDTPPPRFVLSFGEVDRASIALVGGKGANLGELSRAGFPVPPGFCVTTDAWRAVTSSSRELAALLAALDAVSADDADAVHAAGERLRAHVAGLPIPAPVERAIVEAWRALGEDHAYAVRSSATAEDLPGASFAGQQDTYLNVVGEATLLERTRACWASLFTDRAIAYRAKNGFDHRRVQLCVVVQRQIVPRAAGILFTADPVDGHRHVVSIDAGFGLGEALVSGLVNADLYKVDARTGAVVTKKIGDKALAIRAVAGGGTERASLVDGERTAQVLDDERIVELARLGKRIEAHYGAPQDVEWCVDSAGALFVVQARPITTLFPVPDSELARADPGLRVWMSFGHAQVMTEAMPPFALSVWRKLIPFERDEHGLSRIIVPAAGRLFIDPTDVLRVPRLRDRLLAAVGVADGTISAALREVALRPDFLGARRRLPARRLLLAFAGILRVALPRLAGALFAREPERVRGRVRAAMDASWAAMQARAAALPEGEPRLRAVVAEDLATAFPRVLFVIAPVIAAGGVATVVLRKLAGHAEAADVALLARGLEGNVTTEMDLAIGDLADLARASPPLSERLVRDPLPSLDEARALDAAFADALARFLDVYGVRGGGEIDVSRPRFAEDPRAILQVVRGNLGREEGGAHRAHHRAMRAEAEAAARRIVDGAPAWKRPLLRRAIRSARALVALREHMKFQIVRIFWLVRAAALACGEELAAAGKLDDAGDVWMLSIDEVLAGVDGRALARERRAALEHFRRLAPPRVITSEGEMVTPKPTRAVPDGALAGTPASAGVVEGRARVILDPAAGALHAGEILVAPFTDPGWTPLFINAKALVMEVGGMMTHGSVVAREYGIPAVVSVDGATTRIQTGQRLRVDGTAGVVELLPG